MNIELKPELLISIAAALTALTTILATRKKVWTWFCKAVAREAVNLIDENDIRADSFVGEGFQFNERVIEALEEGNKVMDELRKDMNRNHTDSLRVEMLQLIHNTPQKAEVIEHLFEEYVKLGGNSYMLQVVNEWRELHARPAIRKRIVNKGESK